MKDLLYFDLIEDGCQRRIGEQHQLRFGIDHFTGARFGLNVFSAKESGGTAVFTDFVYELNV